jgi:hypothetical protein
MTVGFSGGLEIQGEPQCFALIKRGQKKHKQRLHCNFSLDKGTQWLNMP